MKYKMLLQPISIKAFLDLFILLLTQNYRTAKVVNMVGYAHPPTAHPGSRITIIS